MNKTILAAGGIVWRQHRNELQLALVHRPKYNDWSLPKGKFDPAHDESLFAAALREVREETGFIVRPEFHIGEIAYLIKGKNKIVSFWNMIYFDTVGTPAPDEVDRVEWVNHKDARTQLTYDLERQVFDKGSQIQRSQFTPPFSVFALFSYRASTSTPLQLRREEKVIVEKRPSEWPGWLWTITADGRTGWTPESIMEISGNRALIRNDYDASELTFEKGDYLTALRRESGWLWCRDKLNREGWAPLAYLTPGG